MNDSHEHEHEQGKWENIDTENMAKLRYRFGGERYSFRGPSTVGPDDYIPQLKSLYPFPSGDMQDSNDTEGR